MYIYVNIYMILWYDWAWNYVCLLWYKCEYASYENVTLSEFCEIWICNAIYEIVEYAQNEKCYVWNGLCES